MSPGLEASWLWEGLGRQVKNRRMLSMNQPKKGDGKTQHMGLIWVPLNRKVVDVHAHHPAKAVSEGRVDCLVQISCCVA